MQTADGLRGGVLANRAAVYQNRSHRSLSGQRTTDTTVNVTRDVSANGTRLKKLRSKGGNPKIPESAVYPGDFINIDPKGERPVKPPALVVIIKAYFKKQANEQANNLRDQFKERFETNGLEVTMDGPLLMKTDKIIWANIRGGFVHKDAQEHWALFTYKRKLVVRLPVYDDKQEEKSTWQKIYDAMSEVDIQAGIGVEVQVET